MGKSHANEVLFPFLVHTRPKNTRTGTHIYIMACRGKLWAHQLGTAALDLVYICSSPQHAIALPLFTCILAKHTLVDEVLFPIPVHSSVTQTKVSEVFHPHLVRQGDHLLIIC